MCKCVCEYVIQGDSAHLFSLINIYMTFWQSALQIQQRGKAQLLVVCGRAREKEGGREGT